MASLQSSELEQWAGHAVHTMTRAILRRRRTFRHWNIIFAVFVLFARRGSFWHNDVIIVIWRECYYRISLESLGWSYPHPLRRRLQFRPAAMLAQYSVHAAPSDLDVLTSLSVRHSRRRDTVWVHDRIVVDTPLRMPRESMLIEQVPTLWGRHNL